MTACATGVSELKEPTKLRTSSYSKAMVAKGLTAIIWGWLSGPHLAVYGQYGPFYLLKATNELPSPQGQVDSFSPKAQGARSHSYLIVVTLQIHRPV